MTGLDHEHSEVISLGARRLVEVPAEQRGHAAVPWLKSQFPMTTAEAIEAIRLANLVRSGGVDDGTS
ncbi:hypothetical protein EOA27_14135 [Mesorhizobium sp. M2A.F.Ca.ET.037.01.1.1]|uniref:hypothetical protein n=1 Tax=unclassified Mesorhizobium TaxID=325217 RepID=UPI000FCB4AB9|nr:MULTISPECIES: hypothetical protein [unclassified Mesorhizobium]RUY10310.1 hypothetical protein EOA25_08980 [Mesorhizobium sp. M2A.F.Ca.ET.040.01.1.1]RUX17942.1 hypothetical protein EOA27_14135 [Mesorhizobium sp. M2A.F.Ca.ET.037.01.1.1]RWA93636.1 MAG: hypothetical protein EOQ31_00620 [Mesorhizobium sp.]RWX60635.1 hypothetical protein EOA24_32470 [Mesorhizobium sp. M2A.F.Ca.ET.039.01.1.1]TIV47646.1 MAG: hypothetical protein E5V96_02515 [Mesorhizobium sp.]